MRIKQYIKRTYRILPEQDKWIKILSKEFGLSESEIVRNRIELPPEDAKFDK